MGQVGTVLKEQGKRAAVDFWFEGTDVFKNVFPKKQTIERLKLIGYDYSFWHRLNKSNRHDLRPPAAGRLKEIKVPMLIVTAEHDLIACKEVADLMEREIVGAKKVSIKGAGHCMNMDKPKEFNRIVEKFIRDIEKDKNLDIYSKQRKAIEEKNKGIVRKSDNDEERNKNLVLEWLEQWDRQNFAISEKVIGEDFIFHLPGGIDLKSAEEFIKAGEPTYAGFSDYKHGVEEIIAKGDFVIVRFNNKATHNGMFAGIPPTGKQVQFSAMAIYKFSNGKCIEGWVDMDNLGLMQQLGMELRLSDDEERNMDLVKQLLSEMDQGNPSIADEIISAECIWHMPGGNVITDGAKAFKESDAQFRAGFADLQHHIEELIAIDDKVVARLKNTATHTGSFSGVNSTGKKINVTVNAIYRFKEGKIVEGWVEFEALGLMQQIGAIQWVSQDGNP